jgi:hypothetical protein
MGACGTSASTKTGSAVCPKREEQSKPGARTITVAGRIRRLAIVLRRSLQKRRVGTVEKTAAGPPWKTLRVSHFPTASTAAGINLEVLCSKPKTRRKSHYPWTKNGGQVTHINGSGTDAISVKLDRAQPRFQSNPHCLGIDRIDDLTTLLDKACALIEGLGCVPNRRHLAVGC